MKKIIFCITTVVLIASMLCLPLFSATGAPAPSSYILGDADGNGVVDILDATKIQRILAHLLTDPDGGYTLRGDVDGDQMLTAADVTLIQRHLASLKTKYPIGQLVEAPTEAETIAPTVEPTVAETVAPTQKPTSKPDPYELPPI